MGHTDATVQTDQPFSDQLLIDGADIWAAQKAHPFVTELAAGTLDDWAFGHWLRQDYRYLLDYARTFAIAGVATADEATMTTLLEISHRTVAEELDLHREFAAEYGIDPESLEDVQKTPTCEAYTNFLVRTAQTGSLAETLAAVYPCGQGYLDVADHMAERAESDHRYTPFIEKYTSDAFRDVVSRMRDLVDEYAERYPGHREEMREAFLTSARLEYAFWEMAYTQEGWQA